MSSTQRVPVVLFGLGGVGRALLRQILEQRGPHAERYGLEMAIVGLADSSGVLMVQDGALDDIALRAALAAKEAGRKLAGLPNARAETEPLAVFAAISHRLGRNAVLVDCTASERTAPALLAGLDAGCKLVLANKKPLTIQQEVYNRLTRAGATEGALAPGRVRWETTCGASLPVIVTLNRLLMSGDPPQRMAGTFSGTLGFVMSGLQAGRKFSTVVREAHQLGYTEPDPRDDLGGIDVARKALILARGLGWTLDLGDVEVQGLYPLHMDSLTVAQFLAALPELDEYFSGQVRSATEQARVLRYAATVEGGACRVGPIMVDVNSPLGRLTGTDNLIEFHTRWYTPTPLVIQGRGAGVDVTAAGVLSDIVELAFTG